MELTFREQIWYDKFRAMEMDENSSNLLARFKCIAGEFIEKNPGAIDNNMVKELRKQEGAFYHFCIDSGRLTSDEIYRMFHSSINPSYNPFFFRHDLLGTLWEDFMNIFKK